MIFFYLKSAIGSLRNNLRFSFINIGGFAFAISVSLAITLFLMHEFSHDRYNKHSDRIIRLTNSGNNSSTIDYRVKDILLENYPQIENGCLIQRYGYPVPVSVNNVGLSLDGIMSVDNQFFELFTVEFISGEQNQPLIDNNSAVLTESAAEILFGEEDPMGQEIFYENQYSLTVTAIIKDFPSTSSISAALLVNAENDEFKFSMSCINSSDLSTYRWPFQIFLKLNENTNPNQLIDKINSGSDLLYPYVEQVSFIKLKDIYLHEMTVKSQTRQGNYRLLLLMASIALIILILAVINYVNLTVSQQIKRSKETGIRKTIGAKRLNIFYHFIFESVLVTTIAFFAGTVLLMLLLPLYDSIFNIQLDPAILFRFPAILILPGALLFIGVISGCGPAITLAGTSPLRVISGSLTNTGKSNSSRIILTVFQFSVSIILISSVIIINRQVRFVKYNYPGFNAEYLLRLDMPGSEDIGSQVIYDLLARSPVVNQIAGTNGIPGDINLWMSPNIENSDNNGVPCILVDTAFLKVFGLNIIRGRDIEPGDYGRVCMINEAAWKHFGFNDFENKRFNNYDTDGFEIIGVVNNFHFSSLHSKIDPLFILITPESGFSQLNIRFDGNNVGPLISYIRQIWQDVLPGYPLNYQFYDEWFASMYSSEERFAKSVGLFAFLAVIISCIGLLGMVIFSFDRRTKEIGIRKVNGARVSDLILLLNGDFVKWIAIAFMISVPVAWYAMNRWLQSFAYKTELNWWIFALAGIMALVIALITVSWQSWRAARRNPVEALRYE